MKTKCYAVFLLLLMVVACSAASDDQEAKKQYEAYLVDKDIATLKLSAENGYVDAQKELGNAYYYGKGVEVNQASAALWWHKAATQGNATAQFNLGVFFLEDSKNQNLTQAVMWLEKAVANGDTDAPEQLQIAKEKQNVKQRIAQAEQETTRKRDWVIREVTQTAKSYSATHTYRLEDRFVCVDMAIDVWNQLLTKGIRAVFVVGSSDRDLVGMKLSESVPLMNHIWLVVPLASTEILAIETTTGQVIPGTLPLIQKWMVGIYFRTPAEVKEFEAMRRLASERCREASRVVDLWNDKIAGRRTSRATLQAEGVIEARKYECERATDELFDMAYKHSPK
jgi:hypothetical protein